MHAHTSWLPAPSGPEAHAAPAPSHPTRGLRPSIAAAVVLLAAVLLTIVGQRSLYAALGLTTSSRGCTSGQTAYWLPAAGGPVPFAADTWDPPGCTSPQLRTENLAHHGCELWTNMCIEQGRLISWVPEHKPGLQANFTDRVLLAQRYTGTIPGYPAGLQGGQYEVRDPFMRPAGGVAGSEQPDIDAHAFSHCTTPLVWWPDPAADTSSLFLDTLPWLHAAAVGKAAMLADRKVKFAPDMDGYALPNALHWLLLPLSKRTVEELYELSARHRPPPAQRCFAQVLLCRAGGARSHHADDQRAAGEAVDVPQVQPDVPQQPFAAAQWVADFYNNAFPEAAADTDAALTGSDGHAGGGMSVLVATAQITNAEEVLRKCQDWTPPGSQRPARCEGTAFVDGGMPADVAALRRADILIGTPAAPLAYGLMMRRGSIVMQLWPPALPQESGDMLKMAFEGEKAPVTLLNFVSAPEAWQPSDKELNQTALGRGGTWPAEQQVTLDWEQAAGILDVRLGGGLGG